MRRVVAMACCVTLPAIATAADWRTQPSFALVADANTNRRLLVDAHASESGVLTGTLAILRRTETSQLALTPRIEVSRYSGEDAYDSDDYGAEATWRRDGERLELDVSAGYANDSTLTTELGETGLVETNTRRTALTVGGSLTQYVATRHVLRYQVSGSDIDYQRTAGTGLVGYRYPSAGVTYSYSATPRLQATFAITAARLTAPDIDLTSDTRGAQVGLRFRMSERLDFDASVGRSSTGARGRKATEQSYHAGLSWVGERSRVELSAARDVEPSGRGVLVNADDLRLSYRRQLGERVSFDGSLRATRRADLAVNSVRADYEYGVATLGLSYRLAESWSLSLVGAYSRQDYETTTSADGTRIGLGLTWQPPRE